QGPTFLALADGEGRLLGAIVSGDVHVDAVHYYGNGSTFVWSCPAADPWAVQAYHATGANTYLVLTTPTFMAFGRGEGRFGLWLDAELYNGHSGPCQTFNNKQLSTQAEFVCERLEVWSFQI
ncbi:TLD-domain-containing protein, partial [Caulochytrium protostelioides]